MNPKFIWQPFIKRHKLRVASIVMLGLLSSYCTLLLSLSIGKFLEITAGAGAGKTKALQLLGIHLTGNLSAFFTFFFIILFIKFISNWGYNLSTLLLGESFAALLQGSLLDHIVRNKSIGNESKTKPGSHTPFSNDAKTIQLFLTKGIIGFITDILFLSLALYVLFQLQYVLTLYVTLLILIFYGIQRWYNRSNTPLFAEKRKRQASLLKHSSLMIHTDSQITEEQQTRLLRKQRELKSTLFRFHVKKTFLKALSPFMLYLMLAVIMAVICLVPGPEKPAPGEILTYILLLMTLFPTIRNLIRIENTWVEGALAAEKYTKTLIFNHKETIIGTQAPKNTTNNSFSMLHSGNARQL